MDSDSDECETVKHYVRVRFSINRSGGDVPHQRQNTGTPDSCCSTSNQQDAEHRNHSSFTGKNETNQSYPEIGNRGFDHKKRPKSFKYIEPQNHKSALFVNLGGNLSTNPDNQNQRPEKQLFISPELSRSTCAGLSPPSPPTPESSFDSSSYELIDWEKEKKAFEQYQEISTQLTQSVIVQPSKTGNILDSDKMSHSCNFINWMSATRRRSSSVTPSPQTNSNEALRDNASQDSSSTTSTISGKSTLAQQSGRRASSTDELARLEPAESSPLNANLSTSGNHLAVGDTMCGSDQTHRNAEAKNIPIDSPVQPLEVEIDSPQMDQLVPPFGVTSHPVSLDDILKIDMDDLRIEEECEALEAQAQYLEQKVESLERQQFADDVPRTLVDSIIKHRKELRDLEYEIYKRTLDSEESDVLSCEGKLSQNIMWSDDTSPSDFQSPMGNKFDSQMYYMNDLDCIDNRLIEDMDESLGLGDTKRSSKYGSHLKPGQENTANVLNAVPPPSSLQRRQYLSKATTGTDTSEYSRLPTFNKHVHKLSRHHQIYLHPTLHNEGYLIEEDRVKSYGQRHHQQRHHYDHQQSSEHRVSRQHVQHPHHHRHQQLHVPAANSEVSDKYTKSSNPRHSASPIRPDHFKSEFRSPQVAAIQDSSSTASSSSPQ